MKKGKFIVCLIMIMCMVVSVDNWNVLFASSCHGGGGGRSSNRRNNPDFPEFGEQTKSYSGTITEMKLPENVL